MSYFSRTVGSFVQPVTDGFVTVTTDTSTDWMTAGQMVYCANGGYYEVFNLLSDLSVILRNKGYTGNAAAGVVVPSGSKIVAAGLQGTSGTDTSVNKIYECATDPNGIVTAEKPAVCYGADGSLWAKTGAGSNATGWSQILAILFCLFAGTTFGAWPPQYQRNPITTNTPAGMTNILNSVSATGGFITNGTTLNLNFRGGITNTVHLRLDDGKATYTARPGQLTIAGAQTNKTSFDPQVYTILDVDANYSGGYTSAWGSMGWWARVRDSGNVNDATNTPIIYGLRLDIEPSRTRTNSPYDDATGLLIENSGTGIATDAIYIGNGGYGVNNFGSNNSQWYNLIQLSADADQGVRLNGHFKYGVKLDEGTYTNAAIYLPTNDTVAAISMPTPTTNAIIMDAAHFRLWYDSTNDAVWMANTKQDRPLRFTQPFGGGSFNLYPYNYTGFSDGVYGGVYSAGAGIRFRSSGNEWPPTTRIQVAAVGEFSVWTNWNVSGTVAGTNGFVLPVQTDPPAGTAGYGMLWNSNQCLYWVTSTKTNLISDGR